MIKLTKNIDLKGYVLIFPSVAVGNVAQLAVDLLISNLNLESIGSVLSPAFIPIVGLDPYNEQSDEICTAINIYASADKNIAVIQVRSMLTKRPTEFFIDLQQFVTEQKIAKVVILTSSYAHEKQPIQLQISQFRYVGSEDLISDNSALFSTLQWIKHEPAPTVNVDTRNTVSIPGGGIANSLYTFLTRANIPFIILYRFCSEGDNMPDALELIGYLNQWLKLFKTNDNGDLSIKYPPSWKYLFGNPPPSEIY